jgi:lipase
MSATTSPSGAVGAVLGPRHRTVDVPVRGGGLRVGVWEPENGSGSAPTLLLVHGITASHVCWAELAAALPGVRLLAPDLRGRGRSRDLPGPFGMPTHADDVAAVLRHLTDGPVGVVGHSMGAFVTLVLADRHPDLVTSLLLVDGGMPLVPPPGVDPAAMSLAVLGPAAERLRMTFPDHGAYRRFWADHPALGPEWTDVTGAYVDYDLVGEPGAMHPATRVAALEEDIRELVDGSSVRQAMEQLRHPATWVVAPRGLLDEVPPLYPDGVVGLWTARLPQLRLVRVRDVNHYTVVMLRRGVEQLLPHVQPLLR